MNIIDVKECPACGKHIFQPDYEDDESIIWSKRLRVDVQIKLCGSHCLQTNTSSFVNGVLYGDPNPPEQMHFHVTYPNCDFVWLAPVPRESEVRKAW